MSKTYLKLILASIVLTTVLVFGFAFSVKDLFLQQMTNTVYEKSTKELSIIRDSVQMMHNGVRQFAYQMLESPSVDTLLYGGTMDSSAGYEAMLDLAGTLKMNPMYHSVSIYSGYTGEYYSTLTSQAGADSFFRSEVERFDGTTALTPVCRTLPAEVYYNEATVFSYFYCETSSQNQITKAINVNIDARWLCNYLNALKGNGAKAYILDVENNLLIDGSAQIHTMDEAVLPFVQQILHSEAEQDSFIDSAQAKDQLVTFSRMQEPNWILVVVEQTVEFQNTIGAIRRNLLLIMLGLFVVGLATSIFFSYRLYRPWNKLYRQVVGAMPPSASNGRLYDDVSTICDSIRLTQTQLEEYLRYKSSTEHLLLETYLRALLREDTQTLAKLTDADRAAFHSLLSQPADVAVFRVDHWKRVKGVSPCSADACSYTLRQLSGSIFPPSAQPSEGQGRAAATWIYLGSGNFLLLVFSGQLSLPAREPQQLVAQITELQRLFYEQTGFSATVALGAQTKSLDACVKACHAATELLGYGVLFDRQSILDAAAVAALTDCVSAPAAYDETAEKTLRDAICSGREQDAQTLLEKLLLQSRAGGLQSFLLYLTRLFLHLDQAAESLCKTRGVKLTNAPQAFYHLLAESESLDDIRIGFAAVLAEICAQDCSASARSSQVVDAVKAYIQEHYKDGVALKNLAAKFNFSPGYLGLLFKDYAGLSVLEYTNDVQLEAAERLIQTTNLSIRDVMQECGFVNESNFYRLFKNKYGVTPKSYRVRNRQ